jgi:hypothetical protein
MNADVWDDIVEVCGTENDQDEVVTTFPTNGRTIPQIAQHLRELFGSVVEIPITDLRRVQP